MKLICYEKCSTCKKAERFLEENNLRFEYREYTQQPLSENEIREIWKKSGLPLKRFFNTSGILYREMDMKNRLSRTSEDEQIKLLSENPMLVKRPILVLEDRVLVGFKEKEWAEIL